MSDKVVKKQITVTLIKLYVDALDQLVEAGVYASRREVIQDALRTLFRRFEMPPFAAKEPEEAEEQ